MGMRGTSGHKEPSRREAKRDDGTPVCGGARVPHGGVEVFEHVFQAEVYRKTPRGEHCCVGISLGYLLYPGLNPG